MNDYRASKDSSGVGSVGGSSGASGSVLGKDLVATVESRLDRRRFQDQHWSGTFWEYLDICAQNPGVVRNAYQRLYDAVMSHGNEKYKVFKKDCVRYHFFSDPFDNLTYRRIRRDPGRHVLQRLAGRFSLPHRSRGTRKR